MRLPTLRGPCRLRMLLVCLLPVLFSMLLGTCRCVGILLEILTHVPANEPRMTGVSCCLCPNELQPGVYTLMALSRYRDALVQRCGPERPLVYQPLIPRILTACYHIVLLPPRAFDAHPPVTRDVYYAVALFLQLHTLYPELLLTPWLDTQATFAKLFADIGVEGDVRYAQIDALLEGRASACDCCHLAACASPADRPAG